jgi:colicin import membrane protein
MKQPGLYISAAVHISLLLATLIAFSDRQRFEDAQESVPVDMVTSEQFNQIMRGEKTAKEAKPLPPVATKIADVTETKPLQNVPEGKTDIVAPPSPQKRLPDPGDAQKVEPQKQADPTPPPKPEPPKQTKAEPPKPEPPKDAEAIEPPKPPQRPKEEPKKAEVTPPLPPQRPKPPEPKPAAKPKSGEESQEKTRFDSNAIAQLLSKEAPQQRASTGREVNKTPSLGTQTASAAKMSPSMDAQLQGLIIEQYKQCWTYFGLVGTAYLPQIHVTYTKDWHLASEPELLNPPSDPSQRTLAESALRAVTKCNPLQVPAIYAPYYEQWKSKYLRFDPQEMAG